MSRRQKHPTAKSIRTGQTIFFVALTSSWSAYVVGRVLVGSRKLEIPEPGTEMDIIPLHLARAYLQDYGTRRAAFTSRRAAERECKRLNRYWS